MIWRLLSFVPGTRPYKLYRGTVEYAEGVRQFAVRLGGDEADFPPLPPILRDRAACHVVVESMMALLEALKGTARGLGFADAEAILAEHAPAPLASNVARLRQLAAELGPDASALEVLQEDERRQGLAT